MKRITLSKGGDLRPAGLVLVALVLAAIVVALDMLVAAAAPSVLGVPSDLPTLGLGKVLLASIPVVLGNVLGFYMSYRSYHPRALSKFLMPAAAFFLLFMIPPVWGLLAGGTLASFAAAAMMNIVPVAIAVPALLNLRPDSATVATPSDV